MGAPYKTKDNRWIFPVVNKYERYWKDFHPAAGVKEIMEDPRFYTKRVTFGPKNREDCIRYFETRLAGKNTDEIPPKLVDADTIASGLGHSEGNHSSRQALTNDYMGPITYPNGDAITPAVPPAKMGCMGMSATQQVRPMGANNKAIFKGLGVDI